MLNDFNIVGTDAWTGLHGVKTREDAEAKAAKLKAKRGLDGVVMTAAELQGTPLYNNTVLERHRRAKRREIRATAPAEFLELLSLFKPSSLAAKGSNLAATINARLAAVDAAQTIEEIDAA